MDKGLAVEPSTEYCPAGKVTPLARFSVKVLIIFPELSRRVTVLGFSDPDIV
ncbi:hypothetical protein COMNV_01131 [Commensalibacter sp. Nvir]|nr:hypothetical protein COMNV_01131 [Commensalibacter sp. Nvir]